MAKSDVAVLRTWGKIGRQLDQAQVVEWVPVTNMLSAAAPLFKALAEESNDLLAKSDKLLKPLADPLWQDFGVHRWLSDEREEAYSDWLAWIVSNLKSPELIFRLFSVLELFPDKPTGDLAAWGEIQPEVTREPWVPHGHIERQGRLDLVIRFKGRAVIVVETKMGNADESDTEKQHGYAKSFQGKTYRILLARDGDEDKYAGFRLLRWADLCLALRGIVMSLLKQKKKEMVLATMALGFVGAVEQNLLGLSIAAVRDFEEGRFTTFDPLVVHHLERCVDQRRK